MNACLALGPRPPRTQIEALVRQALAEDWGDGDLTSAACLPEDVRMSVKMRARTSGRLSGLDAAVAAFHLTDPNLSVTRIRDDGAHLEAGDAVLRAEGSARAILAAERVALNFVGRMSGVATLTAAYVDAIAGTGARIACTRKTTPGLRVLEKWAVRCGGGVNHRRRLDDAVLIKDNHIAAAGGAARALSRAQSAVGHLVKIEIEVDRLDQLAEVLPLRPDAALLDNMDLETLARAADMCRAAGVLAEASGGVRLDTVRAIAETGVDVISVGALTHSAAALDVGLDAD